ncbi:MAG: DUF4249 family protein [Bacteroidota bacterium]
MERFVVILIILILAAACEERIEMDELPEGREFFIVDAMLTNEKKPHYVIFSRSSSQMNQQNTPVSGAIVSVYSGDSIIQFRESETKPGYYLSPPFIAYPGNIYNLNIFFEGINYFASARSIKVTAYEPMPAFIIQLDDTTYTMNTDYSSKEDAMWKIKLDWSHVPVNQPYDTIRTATLYFYTLHTIDVSQVFSSDKEPVHFPGGTRVVLEKHALSTEHAAFIRTLLSETEWRGGLFDVTPANIYTNMSEGSLGFFAVTTVLKDSLIVP